MHCRSRTGSIWPNSQRSNAENISLWPCTYIYFLVMSGNMACWSPPILILWNAWFFLYKQDFGKLTYLVEVWNTFTSIQEAEQRREVHHQKLRIDLNWQRWARYLRPCLKTQGRQRVEVELESRTCCILLRKLCQRTLHALWSSECEGSFLACIQFLRCSCMHETFMLRAFAECLLPSLGAIWHLQYA